MKETKLDEIVEDIINKYNSKKDKIMFVLIGGCARAGKTTLSQEICDALINSKINNLRIPLDNWLIGVEKRKKGQSVRERYKYKEIIKALQKIKRGEEVKSKEIYDSNTRTTKKENLKFCIKEGVCIVEGVIALDIKELRDLTNIRIYVDISDNIRTERLKEFYMRFKGLNEEETEKIITEREKEEVLIIKETIKDSTLVYRK